MTPTEQKIKMANVKSLNKEKVFSKEAELMSRLSNLIAEYDGDLSLVAVLGILDLKKIELYVNQEASNETN